MRPSPPSGPTATRRKTRRSDERQYRFLTYVFGGGVEVQEADTVTPVRVASVRGQLRFWWRACNPGKCETVEELRQREGEIWGTTGQASRVEITVLAQPRPPQKVRIYEYNPRQRLVPCKDMWEIAYGAFPLQPSKKEQQNGATARELFDYRSSTFTLRFVYPKTLREDVEAALWAWETFGGLGGRTRRGFGAIARVEGSGTPVEAGLALYREHPRIPGVPSLHQARFATSMDTSGDALQAWKKGLKVLQDLRQGVGQGRNPRSPGSRAPAGRSCWPEPNTIRLRTGMAAPRHEIPPGSVERFPRAVFGMPIIFHFNPGSREEPGSQGDPNMNPQLLPVDSERLASPLIIRPVPEGNRFRTAALVLSSDVPDARLVAGDDTYPAEWQLDLEQARTIPALVRNGTAFTDPLELFLSELKR